MAVARFGKLQLGLQKNHISILANRGEWGSMFYVVIIAIVSITLWVAAMICASR